VNNTVTIVTGGAQGIGRVIAEHLADKGGDIAIFDLMDGSEVVKAIVAKGRRAEAFQVDVSSLGAVEDAVSDTLKKMGQINNLVNNAGITIDKLLLRMKEEDWDKVIRVNLKSVFNCTKRFSGIC
jgi:3-oxoacyl-[acyl-carrier protein] reductase